MPFNRNFHYLLKTEIDFGPGRVAELPEVVKRYSNRVLLVTMNYIPAVPRVIGILKEAGLDVTIFDMVPQNPKIDTIELGVRMAKERKCGIFVGLGGGSSMDAAKAIALMTTHPGNAWEYTIEMGERARTITGEVPPIIAVPTTAGTGSEVSQSASISNSATRQKSPIRSPRIGPLHAVVDPELTVSMPRGLTASTGFEAFCLSFEKFLAPESFPLIDSLAEEAMKGVVRNLKRAMDDPKNLEVRSMMLWESTQGGLCDLAGIRGTGLHAFSLPLSALFDLPRGESLALCMPIVISMIAKLRPRKVARLLSVFEDSGSEGIYLSERDSCETAARRMGEWMKEIGLGARLRNFGIGEGALKELAGSINLSRLRDAWEREVSRSEIEDLYGSIL